MRTVGIFIFDEVEVLDFAGPFEVFSVTGRLEDKPPFKVITIGETGGVIKARNDLAVQPSNSFADAPPLDIVVIPGGYGTRPLQSDLVALDWIARMDAASEMTLSVCTGSLLLGKAGLLDGLGATTHHMAMDELAAAAPDTKVHADARIVDNGRIVTSSGISAGIDMAFHVVSRLHGVETARETASYMEYDWNPDQPVVTAG